METKVSDEELLRDIENTRKEVRAYRNLWAGYYDLASLPELEVSSRRMYEFRATANRQLADDCEKFLKKLEQLRDERGL